MKSTSHSNSDIDDHDDDLSVMALLRAEQTAQEVYKKKN